MPNLPEEPAPAQDAQQERRGPGRPRKTDATDKTHGPYLGPTTRSRNQSVPDIQGSIASKQVSEAAIMVSEEFRAYINDDEVRLRLSKASLKHFIEEDPQVYAKRELAGPIIYYGDNHKSRDEFGIPVTPETIHSPAYLKRRHFLMSLDPATRNRLLTGDPHFAFDPLFYEYALTHPTVVVRNIAGHLFEQPDNPGQPPGPPPPRRPPLPPAPPPFRPPFDFTPPPPPDPMDVSSPVNLAPYRPPSPMDELPPLPSSSSSSSGSGMSLGDVSSENRRSPSPPGSLGTVPSSRSGNSSSSARSNVSTRSSTFQSDTPSAYPQSTDSSDPPASGRSIEERPTYAEVARRSPTPPLLPQMVSPPRSEPRGVAQGSPTLSVPQRTATPISARSLTPPVFPGTVSPPAGRTEETQQVPVTLSPQRQLDQLPFVPQIPQKMSGKRPPPSMVSQLPKHRAVEQTKKSTKTAVEAPVTQTPQALLPTPPALLPTPHDKRPPPSVVSQVHKRRAINPPYPARSPSPLPPKTSPVKSPVPKESDTNLPDYADLYAKIQSPRIFVPLTPIVSPRVSPPPVQKVEKEPKPESMDTPVSPRTSPTRDRSPLSENGNPEFRFYIHKESPPRYDFPSNEKMEILETSNFPEHPDTPEMDIPEIRHYVSKPSPPHYQFPADEVMEAPESPETSLPGAKSEHSDVSFRSAHSRRSAMSTSGPEPDQVPFVLSNHPEPLSNEPIPSQHLETLRKRNLRIQKLEAELQAETDVPMYDEVRAHPIVPEDKPEVPFAERVATSDPSPPSFLPADLRSLPPNVTVGWETGDAWGISEFPGQQLFGQNRPIEPVLVPDLTQFYANTTNPAVQFNQNFPDQFFADRRANSSSGSSSATSYISDDINIPPILPPRNHPPPSSIPTPRFAFRPSPMTKEDKPSLLQRMRDLAEQQARKEAQKQEAKKQRKKDKDKDRDRNS